MNQDTKIVFIHKGYRWYLPYALYQAKSASSNSDIVLIGDNLKFEGIEVRLLDDLHAENIDQFNKYYCHMSTNPEKFESFCWLRWFYLLNYMYKYQVQSILHLDSDVLLYSSIEEIKDAYADIIWDCALSIPEQNSSSFTWTASGHVSYWTVNILEDFCEMIVNSFFNPDLLKRYKEKWDWHLAQQKPGGICDMTTLYLFWEANKNRIINIAKSHQSNVFDINMNIASNYEANQYVTESGFKKVKFIKDRPFLFRTSEPRMLDRVHALHFQAGAKKQIKRFYTGKSFGGQIYADINFLLLSIKDKIIKFLGR